MEQLAGWAIFVDAALAISLIVLAFRFLRGGDNGMQSSRMIELEGSLRELIQHAESAGANLNQELLGRKGSLEKLLFELGTAEHRLNKVVTEAEEERKIIRDQLEVARRESIERGPIPRTQQHAGASEVSDRPIADRPLRKSIIVEEYNDPKSVPSEESLPVLDTPIPTPPHGRIETHDDALQALTEAKRQGEERIRIPSAPEHDGDFGAADETLSQQRLERSEERFAQEFAVEEDPSSRLQSAFANAERIDTSQEDYIPLNGEVEVERVSPTEAREPQAKPQTGVRNAIFPRVEASGIEGQHILRGKKDTSTYDPFEARKHRQPAQQKAAPAPKQPLHAQIEKQVQAPQKASVHQEVSEAASIEDVYARAEQLLRAGHSAEKIASYLQIPDTDVAMLQSEIEQADQRTPAAESGVVQRATNSPISQRKETL